MMAVESPAVPATVAVVVSTIGGVARTTVNAGRNPSA
jgi:hypothetical protein